MLKNINTPEILEIIEILVDLNIPLCDNYGDIRSLEEILDDISAVWEKIDIDTRDKLYNFFTKNQ